MDPWSKGDYSWNIREALMVVEKLLEVNPPSVRVLGRGLLVLPILEARRRQNKGANRDAGFLSRIFGTGCIYRPKGAPGGGPSPRRPGGVTREGAAPHGDLGGSWPPRALLRCS